MREILCIRAVLWKIGIALGVLFVIGRILEEFLEWMVT